MNFILQSKWKKEEISTDKITFNMIIKSIELVDVATMIVKFRNNFKVIDNEGQITIIPSNIKKYNEFNIIKVEVK